MREQILVIDDDDSLLQLLRTALESEGFGVLTAATGLEGLRLAYSEHPDLVLLDLMLPQIDGLEVCRRLQELCDIPILMVTALATEDDVIRGLTIGADDYITKPFRISELIARIRVALRRSTKTSPSGKASVLVQGGLVVDLDRHRVTVNGKPVDLTPTEFRLLACLARKPGRVIEHKTLLVEVWGPEYANQIEYLHLYVNYLRQKIERDPSSPKLIKTERGIGYYLELTIP